MRIAVRAMLSAAAALSMWSPAQAAIELYESPGVVQPDENVLLPTGQTGTTILGNTNNSNTSVTFQSLACTTPGVCTTAGAETLTTPANGQARIEALDGSLAGLQFFLTSGDSFTEFEFNLFQSLNTLQTVTLFGLKGNGDPFTQTFNLDGKGQNYFSGLATLGDVFTKVAFDASGVGVSDIRQVRIGGFAGAAVPEPATWAMMILGLGLVGAAMRRRRQSTVRYSFS